MKTEGEIRAELAKHSSFEMEKGVFKAVHLDHCMWSIALEKIIEDPSEPNIVERTKQLILSFYRDKESLRGMADGFEIRANLWVLGKSLDDFEKLMGIKIK
jgi:hypothetical protein